jgi:gluconate 2-dehydrogenase gamma chain
MSDDAQTPPERRITRRRLLERAGVAAAAIGVGSTLASCGSGETAGQVPGDTDAASFTPMPPMPGMPGMLNNGVMGFFTKEEAETIDAIVARLVPGDAGDPGAREAAVPAFIDTKLAQFESFATPTYFDAPYAKPVGHPTGPQENARTTILVEGEELPRYGFQGKTTPQDAYRAGLVALDRFTRRKHGERFVNLDEPTQDAVLAVLESGKAGGFPQAKDFFKMVLEDTYEGMFADPIYGGNRDYVGWNLVGYPGAQRAYTSHELEHGPQQKRVQSLRDMPAMNPGVPQDHVILPIAGTRPQKKG